MNTTLKRHACLILCFLLTACGTVSPSAPTLTPTRAPTSTPVPTTTPRPLFEYTIFPGDTCVSIALAYDVTVTAIIFQNALSYSCNNLTPGEKLLIPYSSTPPSRPTATLRPTPTPISKFPLAGYIMTFVKDGDLYFQDADNLPVKLSHVGEKPFYPSFSDDNQKIVFSRDDGNEYSINTDGTQEQILISKDRLNSLVPGKNDGVLGYGFIPHTHLWLTGINLCKSYTDDTPCSVMLFTVDSDTGKIKKLTDLGLAIHLGSINRNIEISPDGKMIAAGTTDGMDIVTLDGKVIRRNILPFKPSTDYYLFPSLFWLPDSSGLIVVLPDTLYNSTAYSGIVAYTVWHYSIQDNVAAKIPLDKPFMGSQFDISPDGKWGIYGGFSGYDTALYLADLTTGHVRVFGDDTQPEFSWGLDSKHFVYRGLQSMMGTVDNPSSVTRVCDLIEWIDTDHFTCETNEKNVTRLRMAEIDAGTTVKLYDFGFGKEIEFHVFIKPK